MSLRSLICCLVVLFAAWSAAPLAVSAQAPDYSWTFGSSGIEDYVLTTVSSPDVFSGALPANDPTINLIIGKRYQVTNLDPFFHPLEIMGRGASSATDDILLAQNGPGRLEGDSGIGWTEQGGVALFTVTQTLVDAMNAAGHTPGYRCGLHVSTMRGNFNIAAPPPTTTLSDQAQFVALLNGAQDGTTSTGTGVGRFFVNTTQNYVRYEIRFGGLSTNEIAAHIHGPADPGEPAGIKHPLPPGPVKVGTWDYLEADEEDILAGRMYVNVHSSQFTGGEIRGQIVNFVAALDGAQDGTNSTATGTGFFIINTQGNQLSYHITYTPLVGAESAAHIHGYAPHTVPAPVLHPLPATNPKVGVWDYPEEAEARLLSGLTYANIHSSIASAGEIRGQITRFVTALDGAQDNAASPAHGFGHFSLDTTSDTLGSEVVYLGLTTNETAAHIHGPADPGVPAPVIHPLPATQGRKLDLWNYPAGLEDLITFNRTYVNVHTTQFPAGEIRGQIWIVHGELENPIAERIPRGDVKIDLLPVLEGLAAPVGVVPATDGSGRLFVYDQAGTVTAFTGLGVNPTVYLSVDERLVPLGVGGPGTFDERGLIGFALHPDFAQNGKVYTYSSEPSNGPADFTVPIPQGRTFNHQGVIAEWMAAPPNAPQINKATRREVLRVDEPQFNHNGGTMRFGPDGNLYIAFGDGGGADDRDGQLSQGLPIVGHGLEGNGQRTTSVLGTIIRIDVDGRTSPNGQYGVPAGNPFVGVEGLDEIFAYGFRNPFMFSFDSTTGDLYVGDVGQNDVEELDVVTTGGNYGWHFREGTFAFDHNSTGPGFVTNLPPEPIPAGLIDPIAQYDHNDGLSIIGGFVYRGATIPELAGLYVTGDFGQSFTSPTGRLFYVDATRQFRTLQIGAEDRPLDLWLKGFGYDLQGEIYVCGSGQIGPFGTAGVVLKIIHLEELATVGRWELYR